MLRFFVALIALAISTCAYAENRVFDGCIGQCAGELNDDKYYRDRVGIIPNVEIRSLNMGVYNQLFANSKILHSSHFFNNKTSEEIHRYNILLDGDKLFYGKCELRFTYLNNLLTQGECQLYDGENSYGIAKMLTESFSK